MIPEIQAEDVERLKTVLGNAEITQNPEARMRVQVAFAEGYMAAIRAKPTSRGLRILRILQYTMAIIVLILLTTSLFGVLKC